MLTLQSAGVVLSRLLHLPYPGPVVGMVLLLLALRWPAVQTRVGAVATFLLSHLSLLFVPVGVGLIAQLGLLGQHGMRLMVVVVVSTWVGLGVTALVLQWLLRRATPAPPNKPESITPDE